MSEYRTGILLGRMVLFLFCDSMVETIILFDHIGSLKKGNVFSTVWLFTVGVAAPCLKEGCPRSSLWNGIISFFRTYTILGMSTVFSCLVDCVTIWVTIFLRKNQWIQWSPPAGNRSVTCPNEVGGVPSPNSEGLPLSGEGTQVLSRKVLLQKGPGTRIWDWNAPPPCGCEQTDTCEI